MTYKEAVVISAYTGFLMCDFDDMHKYVEEKLGRPIWTHELALDEINEEIRQKCKSDFIDICKEANANRSLNPIPCFRETPSYQRDCYYFSEEQDMGAHIPYCGHVLGIEGYEPRNCNKYCLYYISSSKAREIIDRYAEEENGK